MDATSIRRDADLLITSDPDLARAAGRNATLPIVVRPPGFATMLHLILEQQVSVAAARVMFDRLTATLGTVTPLGFLGLDETALKWCGFSRQKAGYATALARALLEGRFSFDALAALPDERAVAALCEVRGVGRWTAECYLLFSLDRTDVFPAGDLALRTAWRDLTGSGALPSEETLRRIAARWAPRRSAATAILWGFYLEAR